MATFVGQIKDRQIIMSALVSASGTDGPQHFFNALMDTGAQVTMISRKVVEEAGLQAIGLMPIIPVTGEPFRTEKYRARLDIPIQSDVVLQGGTVGKDNILRGMDLEVGVLPYDPNNHDVMPGMDILSAFHITMYGDSYILSN